MNKVILGDCLEVMKTLEDNSVDSIVTDPPYHLQSIVKRFGKEDSAPAKFGTDGAFQRASKGFMGKEWDGGDIAFNKEMWAEALRVLKPGGHLLSFGGTRTYHRMACAIEDAGFEVRDMVSWIYASGFPKSLNVFKQLQKQCTCGNMDVYEKSQHNLRPMSETDIQEEINPENKQGEVLQSELQEQSLHETMQREEPKERTQTRKEPSLERRNNTKKTEGELQGSNLSEMSERISTNGKERRIHNATQISDGSTPEQIIDENGSSASHRPQSEQQQDREPCAFCKQYRTQAMGTQGLGTALKPACEPCVLARKPLSEKTVALNVLKWGTGGINIDGSRVEGSIQSVPQPKLRPDGIDSGHALGSGEGRNGEMSRSEGRFPANVCHDGSDEVLEVFPNTKSGAIKKEYSMKNNWIQGADRVIKREQEGDSGSASRFFYCAKTSKSERNKGLEEFDDQLTDDGRDKSIDNAFQRGETPRKNFHPTVKPLALMKYLITLITPKGGTVLDPFAGSGSTLVAAKDLGFNYIGIELTPEYIPIIEARLKEPKNLFNE